MFIYILQVVLIIFFISVLIDLFEFKMIFLHARLY